MKLSRTASYAVQAALLLAQADPDTPVPCSRLAAEGDMPERFLLQILRNLVTHGILRSARGAEGGYLLDRPREEISLLELIEAVEGPLESSVPSRGHLLPDSRQQLQSVLQSITATTRAQLAAVTLDHLLSAPGSAAPVRS